MMRKQNAGSMSRWGLGCLLTAAVASAPSSVLAARSKPVPFAVFRFAPDVELEVLVSPEIVDGAELHQWILDEGHRVLDELPDEPARRGSLHVEISGVLYDYKIKITAFRDGAALDAPSTWVCECSSEELLEKLRAGLPERAAVLELEGEPESAPAPAIPPPVTPVDDDSARGRLGPAGAAGVALMTVGAAGVGAGVVLMVLEERRLSSWDSHYFLGKTTDRDFISSGKLAAIGGGGVLVAGVLLYALRKRIDRDDRQRLGTVVPSFDAHGRAHVTITGRF